MLPQPNYKIKSFIFKYIWWFKWSIFSSPQPAKAIGSPCLDTREYHRRLPPAAKLASTKPHRPDPRHQRRQSRGNFESI